MDVDVVIAGGGPAGCSSALALLSRGYSVAVVTSANRKEKPTETATPTLKQLLHSIGATPALSACEPCFGICSDWGRTSPVLRPSIVDPFGHAWFVHRTRFDLSLREASRASGATWIDGQALDATFDSDGVSLLTNVVAIRARWLILATGSSPCPTRITQQKLLNFDSLIAFWVHMPVAYESRLLFVEASDSGWWYVCPDDRRGAIVCFVTDGPTALALGVAQGSVWNELFQTTKICTQLDCKTSPTCVNVALTGFSALPRRRGPRWIAAGDSAVRLDPIGSSGVMTALDSGRRAGNAVADALQCNETGLEQYDRWSAGLIQEFSRQRRQQYAIEESRRGCAFWTRRLHTAT